MKGRENKGPLSADLLVCFPPRAHLTLMPKRICSPAPPSEPSPSHHQYHHHRPRRHLPHHTHLRKSTTSRGHASPILWVKANKPNSSDMSEPTSPKVTCAGQIKVQPRPNSCKNWRSVMQEIERVHGSQSKQKNKSETERIEAIGFKKDAMQFLTCLRNFRFDFRCFGSFPTAEISSDDEGDEDDDEDDEDEDGENSSEHIPPPPPNAMLLMRCRSAPAKSWLEEKLEEDEGEKEGRKQRLTVMRCGAEFSKLSTDIAKETWVVGGIKDMLSRSRSSKR
ncbi:hypothetical protein OROGR_026153 [Orobanche gracilis]